MSVCEVMKRSGFCCLILTNKEGRAARITVLSKERITAKKRNHNKSIRRYHLGRECLAGAVGVMTRIVALNNALGAKISACAL